jgi:hypothetical protein
VSVTIREQPRPPARDAVRSAIRLVLIDQELSQSALARQLSDAAKAHGLRRGDGDKEVRYDPAMVNRWLDGKLVPGRQAAWLLDLLYPRPARQETFQDLRDRFVLESDRSGAPEPLSASFGPLLEGARCSAEFAARDQRRRPLPLQPGEELAITLLSVVDCSESRHIISELLGPMENVRLLAMYDVLGHWDLAVKFAYPHGFDAAALQAEMHAALVAIGMAGDPDKPVAEVSEFTRHRVLTTDTSRVLRTDGSADPRFIVLDSADAYDLLRIQKAFMFIELRTLPEMRRTIAAMEVQNLLNGRDIPDACRDVIEAVVISDDCVMLELAMTCASGLRLLNQLNRIIGRELTRFKAQKYNLIVYTTDESGWIADERS